MVYFLFGFLVRFIPKATETDWSGSTTKTVPVAVQYGDEPVPYAYEVTKGNCKVSITSVSGSYGDITILYSLENDRETEVSIDAQYSVTGISGTYSAATSAGGDSGDDNLTTTAEGSTKTFIWDSVADLGIDYKGVVYFRIKAYDHTGKIGSFMYSQAQKIDVDNAPEAPVLISPTSGYFDKDETPTFEFTIPNPRAGNSKLHFKVELATDINFGSVIYTFESRLDQKGWVYDSDGSGTYVSIPRTGVDIPTTPALIGNHVKFTVQTEDKITTGHYYWRAIAGGVLS